MADKKNPSRSFIDFKKKDIFVIGATTQERAKILFIRSGMKPRSIIKRLRDWGDQEIKTTALSKWVALGKWKALRQRYVDTYERTKVEAVATQQGQADATNEEQVREVYAKCAAQLMNMIHQKLRMKMSPDMDFPIMSTMELAELAKGMERLQDVHFRAIGIPDLVIVDPTQGHDGITVIPSIELKAIEKKAGK